MIESTKNIKHITVTTLQDIMGRFKYEEHYSKWLGICACNWTSLIKLNDDYWDAHVFAVHQTSHQSIRDYPTCPDCLVLLDLALTVRDFDE